MSENGFTLSVNKTQFLVFKSKSTGNFKLLVDGQEVAAVHKARYLRVLYTGTGSVLDHVKANIHSARRALRTWSNWSAGAHGRRTQKPF